MVDIVTIAASVGEVPTMEEADAMLDELRRLPRDTATTKLIDDLLDLRSLLGATCRGRAPSSGSNGVVRSYRAELDQPARENAFGDG